MALSILLTVAIVGGCGSLIGTQGLDHSCSYPADWNLSESSRTLIDNIAAANGNQCFRNGSILSEVLHAEDAAALRRMIYSARPPAISSHELFPVAAGNTHIYVPPGTREIKVSIGEAFCSPNARKWFKLDSSQSPRGLTVYGFEPNPYSCAMLTIGVPSVRPALWSKVSSKITARQMRWLEDNFLRSEVVNTNYFLTCAGISDETPSMRTFHITSVGTGTSSLSQPDPKRFGRIRPVTVNVTTLSSFLDKMPWSNTLPEELPPGSPGVTWGKEGSNNSQGAEILVHYISQLKTDMQGHDLKGLMSAGPYLSQRVVFITPEMYVAGYRLPAESGPVKLRVFLKRNGFNPTSEHTRHCKDAVFLNERLKHLASAANLQHRHPNPSKPKQNTLTHAGVGEGANVACTGT